MRFSAEEQGILVSGDAGCVDFKPEGKKPYYPKLLKALSPLHVVQVAHHAGYNDHFYRVLDAAQYPMAVAQSFLLVSHATHDRHRPSAEFREFVEHVRHDPEIIRVLFTTQPRASRRLADFEVPGRTHRSYTLPCRAMRVLNFKMERGRSRSTQSPLSPNPLSRTSQPVSPPWRSKRTYQSSRRSRL